MIPDASLLGSYWWLLDEQTGRCPRYKVALSGRGAGKSWNFARALIIDALKGQHRILCAREYQVSIADSVHQLLRKQIELLGLEPMFRVQRYAIYSTNGSEFVFKGLRHNPTQIKSMEGITRCWVEEAERVSEESWKILIPTIRAPGSQIWVSFNPDLPTDPTYQRFVDNPPPNAYVYRLTWRDNPHMPAELHQEKDWLARVDPDAYANVWEGEPRQVNEAQVLSGRWRVDAFTAPDDAHGPYYGADWGFAQDPTVLVRFWISSDRRRLYIDHEASGVGVEINDTPALFDRVPGSRDHLIRADSARPETISHVARSGFKIQGAKKWAGSVEDGVSWLRSFDEIIIHDRCRLAIQEARLYSYKTDRLTGDVKPEVEDAHNHVWDAVRYGAEPLIRQRSGPMIGRA